MLEPDGSGERERDRRAAGRTGHEVRAGPALIQEKNEFPSWREE